jgi:hypothetical protein
MPTLSELCTRRDVLSAQRSSGAARVSYDGKMVDYRSVAEIDRAIEALDRGLCQVVDAQTQLGGNVAIQAANSAA